jgi:hypothetical protein
MSSPVLDEPRFPRDGMNGERPQMREKKHEEKG